MPLLGFRLKGNIENVLHILNWTLEYCRHKKVLYLKYYEIYSIVMIFKIDNVLFYDNKTLFLKLHTVFHASNKVFIKFVNTLLLN